MTYEQTQQKSGSPPSPPSPPSQSSPTSTTPNNTSSSQARIIASKAGQDSWKTWAGRSTGTDEFELMDLARGCKRSFNKRFIWKEPESGATCPVCFSDPTTDAEGASGWHITSSCGHAVCLSCLRGYSASLVADRSHHGPLKCPVCPLPLRESDAIVALEGNAEALRLLDDKMRDELLRACPQYRSCPNCSGNSGNGDATSSKIRGGGFVSASCLSPINSERERHAEYLLDLLPLTNKVIVGIYYLYFVSYSSSSLTSHDSIFAAIINVYLLPAWLIHRFKLIACYLVAMAARRELYKPIEVSCPCCDGSFILNAESEFSPERNSILGDKASAAWIGTNTRQCPSCSVPISKASGCNHMRCGNCGANFCWACMRLRTSCRAYNCRNGAPFGGNARPPRIGLNGLVEEDDGDQYIAQDGNGGGNIVGRIDRLERRAMRLERKDLMAMAVLFASVLWKDARPIELISKALLVPFTLLFNTSTIVALILAFLLGRSLFFFVRDTVNAIGEHNARGAAAVAAENRQLRREAEIRNGFNAQRQVRRNLNAVENMLMRQREEEMVAQAIARSLQET